MLVSALNQMKTQVLQKMHQQRSTLFTFMKASPLVFNNKDTGMQEPVSDKYRSNYQFVKEIKSNLKLAKENLQVKFDILTKNSLRETLAQGSKLLHLTSDVVLDERIALEGDLGEVKEFSMRKLSQLIYNLSDRIDLIGIAIPNSRHIGEVFLAKGVKHVLCFEQKDDAVI